MSAFLVNVAPDAVHLYADAGHWSRADERLIGLASKLYRVERSSAVITARGPAEIGPTLARRCAGKSFDQIVERHLPAMWRDLGETQFDIVVAGWSDRDGRARAYMAEGIDSVLPRNVYELGDGFTGCGGVALPVTDADLPAYFDNLRTSIRVAGYIEGVTITASGRSPVRRVHDFPDATAVWGYRILTINPPRGILSLEASAVETPQLVHRSSAFVAATNTNGFDLSDLDYVPGSLIVLMGCAARIPVSGDANATRTTAAVVSGWEPIFSTQLSVGLNAQRALSRGMLRIADGNEGTVQFFTFTGEPTSWTHRRTYIAHAFDFIGKPLQLGSTVSSVFLNDDEASGTQTIPGSGKPKPLAAISFAAALNGSPNTDSLDITMSGTPGVDVTATGNSGIRSRSKVKLYGTGDTPADLTATVPDWGSAGGSYSGTALATFYIYLGAAGS